VPVIKGNKEIIEKVYNEVSKFIGDRVKVIDALSGLILVIVDQATQAGIPKELIFYKIAECWELLDKSCDKESDKIE